MPPARWLIEQQDTYTITVRGPPVRSIPAPLRLPNHDLQDRVPAGAGPRERELDPVDGLEAEARVQRGGERQRGEEALDTLGVRGLEPVPDRGGANAAAVVRRVRAQEGQLW